MYFDVWPDTHTNDEPGIRPYNGNFFDLRYMYSPIFPEDYMQPMWSETYQEHFRFIKKIKKIAKIEYKVNLLLQCEFYIDEQGEYQNEGLSLIDICQELGDMDLFLTPALQTIVQYKWDTYGRKHH